MNTIAAFLQADWVERAGWTLLHSLWQLTAVAAVYAIVAFVLRIRSADARYALGCVAIVAMVGLPVGTYAWLPHVAPWGIEEAFHAPAAVTLRTESPGALPAESPGLLPRELPDLLPSEVRDPPGELTRLPVDMGERVAAPVEMTAEQPVPTDFFLEMHRYMPLATAGWLAGVLFFPLRPFFGWFHLHRLRQRGLSPLSEALLRTGHRVKERLGVDRAVEFVESALVEVPTVMGCLRPMILLPASAITGLSAAEIELILAHELAHVKRHDWLANFAQTVIEILLFYHPAMWWVSHQIRKERENCCDDMAIALGGSPTVYVQALMRLEEQRSPRTAPVLAATGAKLIARVRRLLGQPEKEDANHHTTTWLAGLLVLIGIGMGGVFVHLASAVGGEIHSAERAKTVPTATPRKSSMPGALRTMNDGGHPRPPAKVTMMREVLDAVFGTTFGKDANRFVSRYENAKTFRAIHESFAERAGRFQRVLALQAVEAPRSEYVEARCKWEKAVMLVRLTFDEQEQVTGFWLARDREGPTPKGFRRGGYIVGEPMLKLAGYAKLRHTNFSTLSLSVRLMAPGGGPPAKPPGTLSIWKQTTDPRARSSTKGALVTLLDGTRWQWVGVSTGGGQSDYTFESLSPGKYRAVAPQSGDRFDYISSPIRVVDPSKTTTFTDEYVPPVFRKCQITLKLTDSKTGAPAARFEPHVRYFDHHLAPGRYPTQYYNMDKIAYYNMDKIDGGWQFGTRLPTGRVKLVIYGVWCFLPNGDRAILPRYVHKLDVPAPTSEDAEPLELLLDLATPEMSEAEAAKLWPWEVYGTVKDRAGQPLAGVRVHAHCGVGSAEVAETHIAADGSYRLRLAASPYYSSDRIAKATVWEAWIQAVAPGMAEFTFSQQGDVGLIEDGDEPSPGSFHHHHLRPGFFVKRNEPFGPIDFVMTPEVKLEVELLDTQRQPIEGKHVSFAAVDGYCTTYKDVNGVYSIDQVPPGQVGNISARITRGLVTSCPRKMRFTEGGTYRITVQEVARDSTPSRYDYDLAIRSATDAEGKDVLEQILVDENGTSRTVRSE